MLEALKKKLSLASSDLSSGLTRLKQRKSPSLPKFPNSSTGGITGSATVLGISSIPSTSLLEPYAGEEVIQHYEEAWSDSRDLSVANIAAADRASRHLTTLSHTARSRAQGVGRLQKEASGLNQVASDLASLLEDAQRLGELCRSVEAALAYLDVITDTAEIQGRRLDARFSLAMFREEKVAVINDSKAELSASFCEELESRERRRTAESAEKSALYQEAFNNDLGLYRATGLIANTVPSAGGGELSVEVKALPKTGVSVGRLSSVLGAGQVHGLESLGKGRNTGYIDDDLWAPAPDTGALEAFLNGLFSLATHAAPAPFIYVSVFHNASVYGHASR